MAKSLLIISRQAPWNGPSAREALDIALAEQQRHGLSLADALVQLGFVAERDMCGALAELLGMPAGAKPVAVLCLGPVHGFYEEPMLARERWARRAPLASVVFDDGWGRQADWLDRA